MITYYYLHTNGSLINKKDFPGIVQDLLESDFVVKFWEMNGEKRKTAWDFLVEAHACGVTLKTLLPLAERWGCDDIDSVIYAQVVGCGLTWCAGEWHCQSKTARYDFGRRQVGIGKLALEAMADLCKKLGYLCSKTNGHTFMNLLVIPAPKPNADPTRDPG